MVRWRKSIIGFFLAVVFLPRAAAIQTAPSQTPAAQNPGFQAIAELVLLDLVVRDQRGNPIRDLKADEIEVYEDGVKQTITSFRFVEGQAPLLPADAGRSTDPVDRPPATVPADPARQINLVSFVFERLGNDGRRLARQAALDFIKSEMRPNVFVAVFRLDQRLHILQSFTNNADLLRQAVDRSTLGGYSNFSSQSDAIRQQLETASAARSSAESQAASVGRDNAPSAGIGGNFTEAQASEIALDILKYSQILERQQQGQTSIYSLLSLIRGQRSLAGRKTVIYFSEGLHVPPDLVEIYRTTVSEANRANVSIYAVDARGLITSGPMAAAHEMLDQAAATSRGQMQSRGGRAVTREEVMISESAEASLRADIQGTLHDLANSTGGFLTANTNDLRVGMHRIGEDIGSYYEVGYVPRQLVYDGRFHAISVRVSRPAVSVQTRNGYFAVPPTDGPPVVPYEIPMLAALAASPLPRQFEYRSQALRFHRQSGESHCSLVLEVPLGGFDSSVNRDDKTYQLRFSLLALVKGADGQVLQKFSQDYPLQGPLTRLEALKKGEVIFMRHFQLPPGRYTVETVVFDQRTSRAAARRSVLIVPNAAAGPALSSLFLIKRAYGLKTEEQTEDNPLHVGGLKIIPDLDGSIDRGPDSKLSLYLGIYPDASGQPLQFDVLFLKEGQVVLRAQPELSTPDSQGRIRYVGNLSVKDFQPGQYEIRTVVRQGQSVAQEHTFFVLN